MPELESSFRRSQHTSSNPLGTGQHIWTSLETTRPLVACSGISHPGGAPLLLTGKHVGVFMTIGGE